ncbi:MAG: SRPBCC family protein [Chloroflexi bacterium]|nr:SRPBCC family protein [Chloroflexota bacterium]
MSEFEHSLAIQGTPETVFAFVSDVTNLPSYLPTLRHVEPHGPGRVHLHGEVSGRRYDVDGFYRVDASQRQMEWGADGEQRYRGWLAVIGPDDAASCRLTVHLSFTPSPDLSREAARSRGSRDAAIADGLETALRSIQRSVEGRGGQVSQPAQGSRG